jgi:hypothetical protein
MPQISHSTNGSNLADVLELILDKGIVIAGDIRIKLVEVELLTINLRLLISSVERAREMGIDWWARSSFLCSSAQPQLPHETNQASSQDMQVELSGIKSRLERLERL